MPPDDPGAVRSRRDLHRINAWMGNHGVMARTLKKNFSLAPRRIVELGAGDGRFLLRVAEKAGWKNVEAGLVDLQKNVHPDTIAAFSRIDWRAIPIVADVFDWDGAADAIVANLFLHHFEDGRLRTLLEKISRKTSFFAAVEPHRFRHPSVCGQLLRLIGCNAITRHDATISVRAGFVRRELSALWPDKDRWHLVERRAGVFSHLFIATKEA